MTCILRENETVKKDFIEYYKLHYGKNADLGTLGDLAFIITDPDRLIWFHLIKVINYPTNNNFRELCLVTVPSIADKYDITDLYFSMACLVRGYCNSFVSYFYPKIEFDKFGIVCTKKIITKNIGIFNVHREIMFIYTMCPCVYGKK